MLAVRTLRKTSATHRQPVAGGSGAASRFWSSGSPSPLSCPPKRRDMPSAGSHTPSSAPDIKLLRAIAAIPSLWPLAADGRYNGRQWAWHRFGGAWLGPCAAGGAVVGLLRKGNGRMSAPAAMGRFLALSAHWRDGHTTAPALL